MRDGVLDEQGQESKGQKSPCFLCQSQPQIVRTLVSRFEALCGPPHSWVASVHLPHRETRLWPPCGPLWMNLEQPL